METMRVTAWRQALNFRSAPDKDDPANIIGSLFLLEKVQVTGPARNGFLPCRAKVGGASRNGFASSRFLRPLLSDQREALLDQVQIQWERFERGLGKEHVSPFSGFVGEMWKALRIPLDGTDRDQPWSAAAISFVVRKAGARYQRFRFNAAHSKYVHQAIRAREDGDATAPFWGFRLFERKPQPGDIVARDNPDFAPAVDFDVAAVHDAYRSHTDVIVHVDSAEQVAVAMGGNVGDSFSISRYDLAAGDFLAPTMHTFALLVNRADEVSAPA